MDSEITIQTGQWIDYSYGSTLGNRITLSNRDGGFLIAFIALFDALVGTMIWNILAYTLHSWLSKANELKPQDGLHYQIQALLRNSAEPLSFSRQVILAGWAWRKRASRALRRTIPLALLAISVSLLSAIAGVFSSQIATSKGNVLLTGSHCGVFHSTNVNLTRQFTRQTQLSSTYADNCYLNSIQNTFLFAAADSASNVDCNLYTRPALNVTAKLGNPCPFEDPTVCSVPDSAIVQLDTQFLDSNSDLGINQAENNRVLFRRVNTCSPLTAVGFSNDSFGPFLYCLGLNTAGANCSTYNYGGSAYVYVGDGNVTFVYPQQAFEAGDVTFLIDTVSTINNGLLDPNSNITFFTPVSRLTTDPLLPVTLIFLANRQNYNPHDNMDPWFYAESMSEQEFAYSYNAPGRVLGCVEQVEFCNPTNQQCTDLNSWWRKYAFNASAFSELGMNAIQQTTAFNIANDLTNSSFGSILSFLGANLLNAQQQLPQRGGLADSGSYFELPRNQWQIEVANMMAASNAMLQRLAVDRVTGGPLIGNLQDNRTYFSAQDTAQSTLCSGQRIRSYEHQSFSVLGLAINFTLGGIITLVNLYLSFIKSKVDEYRSRPNMPWISTGSLQLQRMAYEAVGAGEWESHGDSCPVTTDRHLFRMPVISSRASHRADTHLMLLEPQSANQAVVPGVDDPFRDADVKDSMDRL